MADIPEHLRKRAEEARKKVEAQKAALNTVATVQPGPSITSTTGSTTGIVSGVKPLASFTIQPSINVNVKDDDEEVTWDVIVTAAYRAILNGSFDRADRLTKLAEEVRTMEVIRSAMFDDIRRKAIQDGTLDQG